MGEDTDSVVESLETFRILAELSELLGANLDHRSLAFVLRLIQEKHDPYHLAELIKSWRANNEASSSS